MDNSRKAYLFAFKTFGDFGVTIAVPAVIAAILGKWLDNRWQTAPKFLIILLILAFVLTAVVLVKKVKAYGRDYQDLFDDKQK